LNDRIVVIVDSVLVAEHEGAFGKSKAILDLVPFTSSIGFRS
jgi:hypothetical protein